MRREMLRAKIHRITVTERDVEYEGSVSLDAEVLRAADLRPYERIDVYDIDNGNRFSTYLIEGPAGSGCCCVNGAAAHLVEVGDKVILAAYASFEESEIAAHRPRVLLMSGDNRIVSADHIERAGVRQR